MKKILMVLLLLPTLAWASDTTWTYTGTAAVDGAYLNGGNDSINYGATQALGSRTTRMQIFRASGFAIPSGHKADSGHFTVHYQDEGGCLSGASDSVINDFFRLLRDWGEGDNAAVTADAGEVSNVEAKHGVTAWTTPGAAGSGTDRAASRWLRDTTTGIVANGAAITFFIDSVTMNFWNSANYGFVLQEVSGVGTCSASDGLDIFMDDAATSGNRPSFQFWATATGDSCAVTQTVAAVETTTTSIFVQNIYTNDAVITKLKLIWDDDNNPASPYGQDSIMSGFTNPDSLEAGGLPPCTGFYLWWIMTQTGCAVPDTSDPIFITTDCVDTTTSIVIIGS